MRRRYAGQRRLQLTELVEEDILGLDIAMCHASAVQMVLKGMMCGCVWATRWERMGGLGGD